MAVIFATTWTGTNGDPWDVDTGTSWTHSTDTTSHTGTFDGVQDEDIFNNIGTTVMDRLTTISSTTAYRRHTATGSSQPILHEATVDWWMEPAGSSDYAILLVGSGTAQTGSGTTVTLNKPASVQDGLFMIAVIAHKSATAPTAPSGWAKIGNTDTGVWDNNTTYISAYWKVASSEPASWSWTGFASTNWVGNVLVYDGVSSNVHPYAFAIASYTGNANTGTSTSASLSSALSMGMAGCAVMVFTASDNPRTFTTTLFATEVIDANKTTTGPSLHTQYFPLTMGAGAGVSWSNGPTLSSSDNWVCAGIVLRPKITHSPSLFFFANATTDPTFYYYLTLDESSTGGKSNAPTMRFSLRKYSGGTHTIVTSTAATFSAGAELLLGDNAKTIKYRVVPESGGTWKIQAMLCLTSAPVDYKDFSGASITQYMSLNTSGVSDAAAGYFGLGHRSMSSNLSSFQTIGYDNYSVTDRVGVNDNADIRWGVRTAVGETLTFQWAVRAAIYDSLELVWNVLSSSGSAVGEDLTLIWDVRATTYDAADLRWDVRAALADTVDLRWDVRAAIGELLDLPWHVRSLATVDADLQWDTRAAIGEDSDLRWAVKAIAGDSADLQWDVRAALLDDIDLRWGVRTIVTDDGDIRWSVRTAAGDTIDLQWDTRAALGDTLSAIWDVRASLPDTLTLVWDVLSGVQVSDSLTLLWDTRAAFADDANLVWDVRQAIPVEDIDLRWAVRSIVTDDLDVRWALRQAIADDATLLWDVRSAVADTLSTAWGVRVALGETLTLRWNVLVLGTEAYVMAYVGGSWVAKPIYYWDGGSWVPVSTSRFKFWNGSTWEQVPEQGV